VRARKVSKSPGDKASLVFIYRFSKFNEFDGVMVMVNTPSQPISRQ
jgi:hypothetical protein